MMEIRFVRTVGERDRVYVRRSDGSETSWPFPTYGDELPHDLVHLVVERAFGVANGFWGHIDRAQPIENHDPTLQAAETLANAHWGMADFPDEERLAQIRTVRPDATIDQVRAVRAELDELRARWRALTPKGTIVATF